MLPAASSWLPKLLCRSRRHRRGDDNTAAGDVQVPVGFGDLTALHTFGVVNVCGAGEKPAPNTICIIKEINKLTQLRKLGVCGIDQDNVHDFFSAISGLSHLVSLYVRFSKNKQGLFASLDDTISLPPKTLTSVKLHGHVRLLPVAWTKQLLWNVQKLDLEMTIVEQEDMKIFGMCQRAWKDLLLPRLCVKPVQIDKIYLDSFRCVMVLEIYCTSNLLVIFDRRINMTQVEVLKVHCSSESFSFKFSGLDRLRNLKEVWLKGFYSDEVKQDLLQQLAQHGSTSSQKPVLKLLQTPSEG